MGEINLNCGIYQIRNLVTGFCCVGQSMRLGKRPGEHWAKLKNNKHKNSHLQRSYNKHGKEFFVFEILIYCEPEELTYYEQLFCDIDKSHNLSYNIRDCVDSNKGIKWTEETLKKMSEAKKGKNHPMYDKHPSKETCKKISEANKNRDPMTAETRKKMSDAWKNRPPISEETKNRMSESAKNRPSITTDTHKKMSKAQSGKNHPLYGKHHTEETCKRMSKAAKNRPPRSKETCKKISEANKGKNHPRIIKKEIILEVLELLNKGLSVTEILAQLDVSMSSVYKVKNGFYDNIYNLGNHLKGE